MEIYDGTLCGSLVCVLELLNEMDGGAVGGEVGRWARGKGEGGRADYIWVISVASRTVICGLND